MSTRRARIKAVASLPIRKRAVASNEKNEPKTEPQNDIKQTSPERSSPKIKPDVSEIPEKSPVKIKSSPPNNPAPAETNDVSKAVGHRRRTMKPSINVAVSNKRKGFDNDNTVASKKINTSKSPLNNTVTDISKSVTIKETVDLINNDGNDKKNVSIDGIIPLTSSETSNTTDDGSHSTAILGTDINFDPIIPLPSPCKNRPKLKPMPRFALRRNSFQGSASESEDDFRKNKREESVISANTSNQPPLNPIPSRLRNNSVCSLPADSHLHINMPITPRQKPNRTRLPLGGEGRRAAAKKRALSKHPQNPLTMCDLIYYNPPNNNKKPIEIKKDKEIIPDEKDKSLLNLANRDVDIKEVEKSTESNSIAVPQVKLGPNGEIVIDEQSLVIETTDATRSREEFSKLSVVYENGFGSSSGMYRRTMRTREWSNSETLRFYKALNTIGTDFALMLSLFPGRTRKDLKTKFKKEEKHNMALVDKALMNPLNFDISELQQQLVEEQNVASEPKTKKDAKKIKINYRKSSVALRSIEDPSESVPCPEVSKKKKKRKSEKKLSEIKLEEIAKSNLENTGNIAESNSEITDDITESNLENTDDITKGLDIPKNVEPGSIIMLVKKIPDTKNRNTLHAYISRTVDNVNKLIPLHLEIDVLKTLGQNMKVLQDDQEYELATEVPTSISMGTPVRNNEAFEPDDSEILDIDENILDDSTIDNYILTGKNNLISSDSINSPNIINISQL